MGQPHGKLCYLTSGGKHGKNAGYGDERNEDGTWNYVGQGSEGDQDIKSYANKLIISKNKNILLFTTRELTSKEVRKLGSRHKKYKFEGVFDVLSWSYYKQVGGARNGDRLIVFKLIAAENIFNGISTEEDNVDELKQNDLGKLYLQIKNDNKIEGKGITLLEYRLRSKRVKVYALVRADGYCELCEKEAPFRTKQDLPYLEVHHILKLADDGPDEPENVAALCPNCHRKVHFGKDVEGDRSFLLEVISRKQNQTI